MILSISTWWQALSGTEQMYWGIAILASLVFFIQVTLSLIGLDSDLEADFDTDADGGLGIISVRGIIAFLMFFGWGGVASLSAGVRPPQALMIGFLCGFLAMVAVGYIFAKLLTLQETGTIRLGKVIGQIGEIYLKVPGDNKGMGKIHLSIEGKIMEFDAMTSYDTIPTGAEAEVLSIEGDNIMIVKASN